MPLELITLVLGAALGFGAGWAQYWLTQRDDRRRLCRSLLIELTAFADEDAVMFDEILRTLDLAEKTGELAGRQYWRDLLAEPTQDRFPIYYGSIAELGRLPDDIAVPLFKYHTRRMGMLRVARILCDIDDVPSTRHHAASLRSLTGLMMDSKQEAITRLANFVPNPPPTPSPAAPATR